MQRCRAVLVGLLVFCCAHVSQSIAATLRVGFGASKPPYVYEHESRGLEYDLVAAALREGGDELRPYYAPAERLHRMLKQGELDAMATTGSASDLGAFYSDSYIEYQNVVVSLASRDIVLQRIADLDALSVSAFQRARYMLGAEYAAMVRRNSAYREEPRQIIRSLLLYAGRVDAVVADERIFNAFNPLIAGQVDVAQPITIHRLFAPTPYSVGFVDSAARDRFNTGLAALRASGEYARIVARYAAQ